ncbi:type II toxin-antitoxin system PemK/MazF family toxin [Bacteroidota bacterium]
MIKRGDIWWVRFGPSVGGEIQKTRPAVVVSNNAFNRHMNRVQVVALTSNVSRLYPGQSLVKVGNRGSKAMTDQIQTTSKQRLLKKIGRVGRHDMSNLDRAIKVQLGLT